MADKSTKLEKKSKRKTVWYTDEQTESKNTPENDVQGDQLPNFEDIIQSELKELDISEVLSQDQTISLRPLGNFSSSKVSKSAKSKKMVKSEKQKKSFVNTYEDPKEVEAENWDKWGTLSAISGMSIEELVKMSDSGELALDSRGLSRLQKRFHSMPKLVKRHYYTCGKDYLIPEQIPSLNETYAALRIEDQQAEGNYDVNCKVCLWYGDITRLEVDAVVNSCADTIEGTGGVCGAIVTAASSLATFEILSIQEIDVGEVKVTAGYLLPAKYIFHTSGPYSAKLANEGLRLCYMNCLEKMLDMGLRTIAFPCISTGYKKLPKHLAADIALHTVHDCLLGHLDEVDKIIFCVYDQPNWMVYQDLIKKVFPPASKSNSVESLLPVEILRMDKKSIELYKKALDEGKEAVHNIRVMVVGHFGVGKTTLTKRLFGEEVDINHRESTNGIQVHVRRCKVNIETGKWLDVDKDVKDETETVHIRLANLLRQVHGDQHTSCRQTFSATDRVTAGCNTDICKSQESPLSLVNNHFGEGLDMPDGPISADVNPFYGVVGAYSDELAPEAKDLDLDRNRQIEEYGYNTNEAIFSHLWDLVNKLKETSTDHMMEGMADLSVWDFAGQYAFYATHQVFLSRRAVYLLVTDISKHTDDIVQDDDCYLDSKGVRHCRISEFVDFWLNSIHEFCSDENSDGPPVILVGTFVDKLNQDTETERIDEFFYKLRSSLVEKATVCHLTEEDFAIDNTKQDDNVDSLKRQILQTAARQQYWGELIPAKWITLENILLNLKKEGLKVLFRDKLLELNQKLPIPIESEEEVILFLKFHHESGNIIYFCNDEKLKETIILDPQWLVDAFKSIITAKMFCCRQPAILKKWIEFDKTAVLRMDLIDAIWEREGRLKEHSKLLLEYLEKLGLIAKPCHSDTEQSQEVCEYFFAPSVLKEKPPIDLLECKEGNMVSTSKLCFTTPSRFLPTAVFNKLLAVCLAKYPLSHYKSQSLIYCGCGIFDLENNHRLFVYFYDNVIQIWLSRYGVHKYEPEISLCLKVHDFIINVLQQHLTKIESFVKCKTVELDSMEDMFDIEELSTKPEVLCSCQGNPHAITCSELKKFWRKERNLDDKKKQPSDQDLNRMAHKIGKEYTALGIELGLSQAEMDHINMEQRTVVDKITAMLIKWRDKSGKHATTEDLRLAMMLVGIDAFYVIGSVESACL